MPSPGGDERPADRAPSQRRPGVDRAAVGVMTVGVVAAVVLMGSGLLAAAGTDRGAGPSDRVPERLFSGLLDGDPTAIAALGVVVLLATPIARLAMLAIGFGRRRERLFVWLTGLVLAELVVSGLLIAGG